MKQELSSLQTSPAATHEPTAVYDALAHSILAHAYKDAFLQATGLAVELVPRDESPESVRFRRGENAFCRLMARSTGSCAACREAHEELQREVAERLTPQVIRCFAGFAEFAVPVKEFIS